MNIAIGQINRRAGKGAFGDGFIPQAFGGNFIDEGQDGLPKSASMSGAKLAGALHGGKRWA